MGTPQGSVISPLLFNIVMIRAAKAVAEVKGIRHTVYADDIGTQWTAGGTDAGIERRIQKAVRAIENSPEGTGLECSPAKSELLTYSPRKQGKQPPPPRESDRLEIVTKTGQRIPEVQEIRVLGMHINAKGNKGNLMRKLATKTASTMRLLQRVSTKKMGMREEALSRLVQSFAISHVAYTVTYHKWTQTENAKIDIMMRRMHKRALGLSE